MLLRGREGCRLPVETRSFEALIASIPRPLLRQSATIQPSSTCLRNPRPRRAYATPHCEAEANAQPVEAAYQYCRRVTREVARTFYYGSLFLPPVKRRAAWALYAFCRTVDDIADEPDLYSDPLGALAHWRSLLRETYAGQPRGPVMVAWADMLSRFDVPLVPALELLAGVEMDVRGAAFRTFEDLRVYCYRVAGTVGLLMAPVLGYRDPAALGYAVDLGIAMQLTNILRDIGEDVTRGRIYLPEEDLIAFGCGAETLARRELTPAFQRLIAFEIARAETYYKRGMRGVALLDPDSRLAIALSGSLYRAILARIRQRDFDVFTQRAHISLAGKLAALPGAWWRTRQV